MDLLLLDREDIGYSAEHCVFDENIYLFDLAESKNIIGARAPFSEMKLGEDPFFNIGKEEMIKIEDYLKSYSEEPIARGEFVFLPYLMPSSSIGIAVKSNSESNASAVAKKLCALKRIEMNGEFPRDITAILRERISLMAKLAGVRVCIDMGREPVVDFGFFEEGIFRAFVFLSLLFARRASETRGEDISVTMNERLGMILTASFSIYPQNDGFFPELTVLRSLAMRKNIYFDCAADGKSISFSISPVTKDWSKLGLKQDDFFDWNG